MRQQHQPKRLLKFTEFVVAQDDADRRTVEPTIREARKTPRNINDDLPVMLTFQRKEIRQFSDGTVVGKYREVRTGTEIIFPIQFSR